MATNITTLIEAGADAFTNLFDVKFIFPTNAVTNTDKKQADVSVRIQDFPFPVASLTPYTIAYKAITMKRFAPKIEMDRRLSLPIRLDSEWSIYKYFKKWKSLYFNDDSTDINFSNFSKSITDDANYGTIEVVAYSSNTSAQYLPKDAGTIAVKKWIFKNVACINVQEPTFTRDSASPLLLNTEFLFGVYIPAEETTP
jgi:hypothetical protein